MTWLVVSLGIPLWEIRTFPLGSFYELTLTIDMQASKLELPKIKSMVHVIQKWFIGITSSQTLQLFNHHCYANVRTLPPKM